MEEMKSLHFLFKEERSELGIVGVCESLGLRENHESFSGQMFFVLLTSLNWRLVTDQMFSLASSSPQVMMMMLLQMFRLQSRAKLPQTATPNLPPRLSVVHRFIPALTFFLFNLWLKVHRTTTPLFSVCRETHLHPDRTGGAGDAGRPERRWVLCNSSTIFFTSMLVKFRWFDSISH